jgi:hypothetical protein
MIAILIAFSTAFAWWTLLLDAILPAFTSSKLASFDQFFHGVFLYSFFFPSLFFCKSFLDAFSKKISPFFLQFF